MASKRKIAMLAVVLVTLSGVGIYKVSTMGQESTDDATLESNVVTIAPKVSGYIKELNIKDNQQVKAGDVIALIDPADYQIAVDKAQSMLDAAKARLEEASQNYQATQVSAPSGLDAAQAQVSAAQSTWENAARTLKRMRSLNDLARSKQQLDDAVAAEGNALAALNDAKARLNSAQTAPQTIAASAANIVELNAEIKQAEADLEQAKKNLNDTKILAPIDGKITNRGVELGNYVQSGQNLMSLVSPDFWVIANFKETQLTDMKIGQKVKVEVDAFPDLDLEGHVDSIQSGTGARFSAFPPQNATGNFVKIVQRVPVKIVVDHVADQNLNLGPGMSVISTVYTGE